MTGHKVRRRASTKQQAPRIPAAEASKLIARCSNLLENAGDILADVRRAGLGELLGRLEDKFLELAVQPDSWGERARARLMSDLAPALGDDPDETSAVSIQGIERAANLVMPCVLLEIGRRKEHVQIEFPAHPTDPQSRFRFRAGPSHPIHSITYNELVHLVAVSGESLVGLCYFGDEASRRDVESELSLVCPHNGPTATS